MGLNIHRDSLTFSLLQDIEHGARLLAAQFGRRGGIAFRPFSFEVNERRRSWNVRRALGMLQRRGYITVVQRQKDRYVHITKQGRNCLFDASLRMVLPKRRRDGRWRIVCFDIPETKRRRRILFQTCLRDAGFFRLQRSMYVTPYPCEKEISEIKGVLRLTKEIVLLESAFLGEAERRARDFFRT